MSDTLRTQGHQRHASERKRAKMGVSQQHSQGEQELAFQAPVTLPKEPAPHAVGALLPAGQ